MTDSEGMVSQMMVRRIPASWLNAWMVASIGVVLVLAAPMLLPAELVLRLAPTCLWKSLFGVECPACGMTRGFVLMSQGLVPEAQAVNRFAPFLYGSCVLNTLLFAAVIVAFVVRRASALRQAQGERIDLRLTGA